MTIPDDVMKTAIEIASHFYMGNGDEKIIAQAILAERDRDRWMPIETCPTDGTCFLVWCEMPMCVDKTPVIIDTKIGEDWLFKNLMFFHEPTHWQPLPAPPAIREGE